ncbi:NADPH-dependent FMN reductase [Pseudonocardia sp. TRM90224]|uniref:NADPH-dependent FMN reductase n=1 Tax=Pseudonocardia sp. TRM90224 TaxID=2812678 RepID=UPI001E39D581|nr:NADPH-dependent FMN reductase [Pseudonocardia sp. TRM90224]
MTKIVMISGSLRAESTNSAMIRAAAASVAACPGVDVEVVSVDEVPLFNEDVEAMGDPFEVIALKRTVGSADVLLICTPEYNASVPGVLKNALDWLSRPSGESVLTGMPVATMSASTSGFGARWAQDHLRSILVDGIGAVLVDHEPVCIRKSDERVVDGMLVDREALAEIRSLVATAVGTCLDAASA